MGDSGIYLIGSIHIDQLGARRLERILDTIQPKTVIAEIDEQRAGHIEEYGFHALDDNAIIAKIMEKGRDLKKDDLNSMEEFERIGKEYPESRELLLEFLRLDGYEYLTAKSYCASTGAQLLFGDTVDFDDKKISGFVYEGFKQIFNFCKNSGINVNNLQIIPDAICYSPEQAKLERLDMRKNGSDIKILDERENYTESLIRTMYPIMKKPIVYIGGMNHLSDSDNSLFCRLKELRPISISLLGAGINPRFADELIQNRVNNNAVYWDSDGSAIKMTDFELSKLEAL